MNYLLKRQKAQWRQDIHSHEERVDYLRECNFVAGLIDATLKIASADKRLSEQIYLFDTIELTESRFGVNCAELDTLRDEIHDSLCAATEPNTVVKVLQSCSLFVRMNKSFLQDAAFQKLLNQEKLRILRIRCCAHLDGQVFDDNDVRPEFQKKLLEIDASVEEYSRQDFTTLPCVLGSYGVATGYRQQLLRENGISIKTFGELNPDIIID